MEILQLLWYGVIRIDQLVIISFRLCVLKIIRLNLVLTTPDYLAKYSFSEMPTSCTTLKVSSV